jgi:membrane associated rhomboid family serine protease
LAFRPNWYESDPRRPGLGFGAARGWTAFRWILTANLAVFLVQIMVRSASGMPWVEALGGIRAWWPGEQGLSFNWFFPLQLASSPWIHGDGGHIFWNMYALWLFGPELESELGRGAFWRLYLGGALVAGVAEWASYLIAGAPSSAIGASGAVMAVTVLFALKYPHRQLLLFFAIPVPVWLLTVFYVLGDISGAIGPGDGVAHLAHLGGAAWGLLWWKAGDVLSRWVRQRRRDRAFKDFRDESIDRREMDRILAKIQASGLASLDRREREFLDRRSRQLRDQGR